jgi:hypothetical protein
LVAPSPSRAIFGWHSLPWMSSETHPLQEAKHQLLHKASFLERGDACKPANSFFFFFPTWEFKDRSRRASVFDFRVLTGGTGTDLHSAANPRQTRSKIYVPSGQQEMRTSKGSCKRMDRVFVAYFEPVFQFGLTERSNSYPGTGVFRHYHCHFHCFLQCSLFTFVPGSLF